MKRLPKDVRKKQIAEAALVIIAERGLSGLTTSAMAKEIGLSEGTIFKHFKSKEEIVEGVIDILEAHLAMDQNLSSLEPLERLKQFILRRFLILKQKPGYLKILLSSELEHTTFQKVHRRMEDIRQQSIYAMAEIIELGQNLGKIRKDISPSSLVLMIHGMLMALVFNRDVLEGSLHYHIDFDHLWKDMLNVLECPRNTQTSNRSAS